MSCDFTHNFATLPVLCLQDDIGRVMLPPLRFILFRRTHQDSRLLVARLLLPELPRSLSQTHDRAKLLQLLKPFSAEKMGSYASLRK